MSAASSSQSHGRKRTRPSFLADSTPSDPAFFSSDPADANAEDYFSPRKKKQYKGTWWKNDKEQRQRKAFERNLDSGVFMGSDSSVESVDTEDLDNIKSDDSVQDESLGHEALRRNTTTSFGRPVQISEPASVLKARTSIAIFAENGGIDDPEPGVGAEIVNLADLGLPYLTDDILMPLRQMVRQPLWRENDKYGSRRYRHESHVDEDHSSPYSLNSDEDLAEFDESFGLKLDNNALSDLPPSLFTFSGLKRLSLRNNNITALSTNLSGLRRLELLDVSGNRLRWLPGELIDLIRITEPERDHLHVMASFNPLLQPFSYVGFRNLIEEVDGGQSELPSLFPDSIKELRERIERIERLAPNNDLPQEIQKLRWEQKSWLLKLYQHCLANPDVIWFKAIFRGNSHKLPEGEKEEITKRWEVRDGAQGESDHWLLLAKHNMLGKVGTTCSRQTLFIAATNVCYLDISGKPVEPSRLPVTATPMDQIVVPARLLAPLKSTGTTTGAEQEIQPSISLTPRLERATTTYSRVRSLFSLSLASAATVPEIHHLPSLLPDDAPDTVRQGLQHAISSRKEGGRTCYACQRSYIVPRASWLEYHVLNRPFSEHSAVDTELEDLFVPILRTVCSWGCVPHFEISNNTA